MYQLRPNENGQIGHDYYYSFIRLFIGAAHFWQYPLQLPQYTAALCGGLPFFADPQNPYFSLMQFASFVVDPLLAARLTLILCYAIGYSGMYFLFNRRFGVGKTLSHLGSLCFSLNGFYFANAYVGHLTHHGYVLFPWILYFLFSNSKSKGAQAKEIISLSFMVSYLVYSGGFHLLYLLMGMIFLILPAAFQFHLERKQLKQWLTSLVLSFFLVLLICSGKLVASYLYSQQFHRNPLHHSGQPNWKQLTQYFWPYSSSIPHMRKFGEMYLGPWEFTGSLSVLLIPLTLLLFGLTFRTKGRKITFAVSLIFLVFYILIALGKAGNERIPVISLYHNPIKLLGALIPPAILIAFLGLNHWIEKLPFQFSSARVSKIVYFLLAIGLFTEFGFYSQMIRQNPFSASYAYEPSLYTTLKKEIYEKRAIPPTQMITVEKQTDISGLVQGTSSLKCYEPLFGYENEGLKTKLNIGKTQETLNGTFNLTHPGCLLYSNHFKCLPWDRIPIQEASAFASFIGGNSNAFSIPYWQSLLYLINGVGLLIAGGTLVALILMGSNVERKRRSQFLRNTGLEMPILAE